MKNAVRMLIIVLLMGLIALPVLAGRTDKQAVKANKAKTHEKIRLLRMWKMIDYLDLDEQTGLKLFNQFKEFDAQGKALKEENRELIQELRLAVEKKTIDEQRILDLVQNLRGNMNAEHNLKQARLDAVKEILTVEQQGKYILFEIIFKVEMAKLVGKSLKKEGKKKAGMK